MNDEHKKNDVRGMWGGSKGKETRIGRTGKNTAMATTKKGRKKWKGKTSLRKNSLDLKNRIKKLNGRRIYEDQKYLCCSCRYVS